MTGTRRSLATRMLVLALVQVAVLAAAALAIWYVTVPHGDGGPPPGHGGPPPGQVGPPPERAGPPRDELPVGPLATLAVAVAVLAAGAYLTARWLVRPLRQLTDTTRALAAGELGARSGVSRDDELGELARRLDDMGARIVQMLQHERELLANVAHELRTPLARIGVALDLANEGDSERARASLAEIAIDVGELEVLVDDILTALRYDVTSGASMPLRRQPIGAAEIATAAAQRMRGRHPDRPLVVELADGLPAIDVDPALFRRALDNLLDNAHKYTPDRLAAITLSATVTDATVTFAVEDPGIGIATGDLPNVYQPFFRAERSRAKETGGVGLGLTLAKRIVTAHSGTIELTSVSGRGTRAAITIAAA